MAEHNWICCQVVLYLYYRKYQGKSNYHFLYKISCPVWMFFYNINLLYHYLGGQKLKLLIYLILFIIYAFCSENSRAGPFVYFYRLQQSNITFYQIKIMSNYVDYVFQQYLPISSYCKFNMQTKILIKLLRYIKLHNLFIIYLCKYL